MLVLPLLIGAASYFILKTQSEKTQKRVIFALSLVNLAQHLLKSLIYPIYEGQGFSGISTAYNICALLIIVTPIALLSHSQILRDFVFLGGAFAGFITGVFPYWYIGTPVSALGIEYARFFICHTLLHLTGILPLLLGHHKLKVTRVPLVGISLLISLSVILLNDVVFITLGLFPELSSNDLYGGLCTLNPAMIMGPQGAPEIIADIADLLTPDKMLKNPDTGAYVPILWYAIPLYICVTLGSLLVIAFADLDGTRSLIRKLCRLFGGKERDGTHMP